MTDSRRLRVLLLGHALDPTRGSEPGLMWNLAWHLSALHEVHVVSFPENRAEVEDRLASDPRPSLTVHWAEPRIGRSLYRPGRGYRFIRVHYLLWLPAALQVCRALQARQRFDVAHHVGWGTVQVPSPLRRLDVPWVWGPLGGGQASPPQFLRYFGRDAVYFILRRVYLRLLPLRPALRTAVRNCSAVLAANTDTVRLLRRAGVRDARLFLDNAVPPALIRDAPVSASGSDATLRLLWAGRHEARKTLPLLLDALALLPDDCDVHLTVAGDGPRRNAWEAYAERLGLTDRVTFIGAVPWPQMSSLFAAHDVFAFTSLQDSFGSVVLEAASQGMPLVVLDHQGVGDFVPAAAAEKVPVRTRRKTTLELSRAVERLAREPQRRSAMGQQAWRWAKRHTWPQRAEELTELYQHVVDQRTAVDATLAADNADAGVVRRVLPGLADAATGSLSTFLVGLYAARYLPVEEVGLFAVFFTAFVFIGVIPAELVLAPHELHSVKFATAERLRLLHHSVWRGVGTGLLAATFVIPFTVLTVQAPGASAIVPLALTAGVASSLSPVQDHIRRMAHLGGVSWVAASTSAVQLAAVAMGVVLLHGSGINRLWIPFGTLAAANVISGVIGTAWCLRRALPTRLSRMSGRSLVDAGGWLLVAGMAPLLVGLLVNVGMSRVVGLRALGQAEAARLIAQPVLVLGLGLMGVMGPRFLETRRDGDNDRALRLRRQYLSTLGAIVPLYLAVVALPGWWNPLSWLIPAAYQLPGLAALQVGAFLIAASANALRYELTGSGLIRRFAFVETRAAAVRLGTTFAAAPIGAYAIPAGMLLGYSMSYLTGSAAIRRHAHRRGSRPREVPTRT